MDLSDAEDAVEATFEAFGLKDPTLYAAPGDEAGTPCTVVLHRDKEERERGGFSVGGLRVAERGLCVLVRDIEVAAPVSGGIFTVGEGASARVFEIGEDTPVAHDIHGLVWRCEGRWQTPPPSQ